MSLAQPDCTAKPMTLTPRDEYSFSSLFDFIANMLLIEAKTVTQRNWIVVDLKPDSYAQIINGEWLATYIFKIDDGAIAGRAEAVASMHGPLQQFGFQH